ncbi:hypothetical protein LSTR_LSTR004365 [Laodelphax striatellus]|uniref:Gustatory receptor n=1 Tax=Laodelphax striatellus TaxID=195883 RepID=A0A482X922_LAOST|nr:hypothetical protein LSTR_LSTR004365 [Laodelphax striatellus]
MCKKHSDDHTSKGSIFIILETVVLSCAIFYYDSHDLFITAFLMFVKSHVAFVAIQLYEINLKLRDAFGDVNKNFEKVADRYGRGIFTVSSYLPFVETVGRIERDNLPTIPVLIDLHWTLCKIVGMLGDYLGIKLLLVVAYSCLIVINVPYVIITIWLSSKNNEKIITLARKALEIVMSVVEILFLIVPCVLTANEAKKTSKLVCALLNKHLPSSVRKQLEKSVQLLKVHNAELSVIGLFKFDLSVITSIAGVACTYLIIFIQHKAYSKIGEDINYSNNTQNYTQT